MTGTFGKRKAIIAGVAMSQQGDLSDRTQQAAFWDVVKAAIADAGLRLADIDGLIDSGPNGVGMRTMLPGSSMADLVGRPLRFQGSTAIGASGTAAGLGLAVMAIEHGLADVVIIPTAMAGKAEGYAGGDRDGAVAAMAKLGSPYEFLWGTTRVADYAVIAQRHMYEYGTKPEHLAEIAVAQRHGATLQPLSAMGKRGRITIDDVLGSKMIAEPLHLLDSCIVNQGAGCIVVAAEERIDRDKPKIQMIGYGQAHGYLDPCSAPSLTAFAGSIAADTTFAMAGLGRNEIDVVGMSDHFTINVLIGLEDAGFCKKGEGGAFVEGGALGIAGRLPTNTAGGFLSCSHAGMCGVFTVIELVEQLRGTAGSRQVKNARLGYVHGMGGVFQNHFAAILARD